jgi:hypothetical protein
MFGMTDGDPTGGIWNWSVGDRVDEERLRSALAGALECPVASLEAGQGTFCDVYQVGGDFPTVVDVYFPSAGLAEATIASAVAVRLGAAVLLPDDTLNPSRYVHAGPDGSLRAVHVDEIETDDGAERRHMRPCTGADPACAAGPGCSRSRFKPETGRDLAA